MKLYLMFRIKTGGKDKDKVLRWCLEAVARRCSAEKNFSKISKIYRKAFTCNFIKKRLTPLAQLLSSELGKTSLSDNQVTKIKAKSIFSFFLWAQLKMSFNHPRCSASFRYKRNAKQWFFKKISKLLLGRGCSLNENNLTIYSTKCMGNPARQG